MGINRLTPISLNTLQNQPIDKCNADLISFAIQQHPDTAEGHTQHCLQCATWHMNNPTSKPDERHQYPLTLGTSPAGSLECWSCGQKGHCQGAGPGICPGDNLPKPEWDWHRISSYITREYNKQCLNQLATMNHISSNALIYPEYHQSLFQLSLYPGDIDDNLGKGQGSSV